MNLDEAQKLAEEQVLPRMEGFAVVERATREFENCFVFALSNRNLPFLRKIKVLLSDIYDSIVDCRGLGPNLKT